MNDDEFVKELINDCKTYFIEIQNSQTARYKSWEHCYNAFQLLRKDTSDKNIDYLSLHLAWYLASWGMLRGRSFLLQNDYKIHIPVVKLLTSEKYSDLYCTDIESIIKKEYLDKLFELSKSIIDCYKVKNNNKSITETLVSKILLGSIGCVPAYDRYFKSGIKRNRFINKYCESSIRQLAEFYIRYENEFESVRNEINKNGTQYTQMKIIDMCFWQNDYNLNGKK